MLHVNRMKERNYHRKEITNKKIYDRKTKTKSKCIKIRTVTIRLPKSFIYF
jgi:hypothetical protein